MIKPISFPDVAVWGDTAITLEWRFLDADDDDAPVVWVSGTIRILDASGEVQVDADACTVDDDPVSGVTDALLTYSPAFGSDADEIDPVNSSALKRGCDAFEYRVQFRGTSASGVKHSGELIWRVRPPL